MKMVNEEKTLHELFDISILLKGIHAVIEIVGGVFAFLVSPDSILHFVVKITQGELLEDPNDTLTNYFLNLARNFSLDTKQFVASYLFFHGIINLVLVIGLFKKKIWAYHASFFVLTIFIFYQVYRYIYDPSIFMIALSVFDIVVIWLIGKEYKRIQK